MLQLQSLNKKYAKCMELAQECVDIISNVGMDQMAIEGIRIDPDNIDIEQIANMAAKRFNADPETLRTKYLKLMILLDYAE